MDTLTKIPKLFPTLPFYPKSSGVTYDLRLIKLDINMELSFTETESLALGGLLASTSSYDWLSSHVIFGFLNVTTPYLFLGQMETKEGYSKKRL